MAIIGTLGDIVFSVSREMVNTFDGLQWDSEAKYTEHDRHLITNITEFTGTKADSMSFSMYFSAFLGVKPMDEIVKILDAEREGKAMRLVIGSKAYGRHKWNITKSSKALERFDNKGNLLRAKVNITLKAYVER